MVKLAALGGKAVAHIELPSWPTARDQTLENVRGVLFSGRWALSGTWQGSPSAEAIFAQRFAEFNEVPYCVPTTNGTSSLIIALEALDVGDGDEVIIPGLTWVANGSTVLAVNARPVMVDIDQQTLCMSPQAVEAAITSRTAAIVVVHLYSSLADLDAILAIAASHGIPVIEDCAQAHGARWRGNRVGTLGAVGTYSMQQTKLLTAGEGGAAICHDEQLYDRLYQLRSDGRRAIANPAIGEMELTLESSIMGANYCMSELCAAVLNDQLVLLEEQNSIRSKVAAGIDSALVQADGVTPICALQSVTLRTFYYYTARIDRRAFAGVPAAVVCHALRAETGLPFQPTYPPLNQHPLYQPRTKRRFAAPVARSADDPAAPNGLAECERAHLEVLTLHHSALLLNTQEFDILAYAIEKLQRHVDELRSLQRLEPRLLNPL